MILASRREFVAGAAVLAVMPRAAPAANSEDARLAAFFEDSFGRRLAEDPLAQTGLGLKTAMSRWPDTGEASADRAAERLRADLGRLRTFDPNRLGAQSRLSYRVFEFAGEAGLKAHRWRDNHYPVCQMRGPQRSIPQTLINNHPIADQADAEAYIARLIGVKTYLAGVVAGLDRQAAKGVRPPNFSYPLVIENCENLIRGAPFGSGPDSPILADFRGKIAKLMLADAIKAALIANAEAAMREGFGPGFRQLIDWLRASQVVMARNDGVWALPEGDGYYLARLDLETTLPLKPEEVHKTGLEEVARIRDAMATVMRKTGFTATLADFFRFLSTDKRFYYPETAEGKADYLAAMRARCAEVESRLGEIMTRIPRAKMIVKPVEPWLEKSAGTAGYFPPAPDGSRPGMLYVNTVKMRNLPIFELSSLSYHEGVPGHHLENSISQELTGLPAFRRHGDYTAYGEGWALYAEQLPYAMGLYSDPYQEFGQLSNELMRAGRLVVDTGVHHLRWSRERAVAWLDDNTSSSHEDNITAIQRYIVTPGQATAYETGKLKMMDLRVRAERKLGSRYDLRTFNDALLGNGPLPLALLDETVTAWIDAEAAR